MVAISYILLVFFLSGIAMGIANGYVKGLLEMTCRTIVSLLTVIAALLITYLLRFIANISFNGLSSSIIENNNLDEYVQNDFVSQLIYKLPGALLAPLLFVLVYFAIKPLM